jgi:hypothetical protein
VNRWLAGGVAMAALLGGVPGALVYAQEGRDESGVPSPRCPTPVAQTAPSLTVRAAERHDTSPPLSSLPAVPSPVGTERYQARGLDAQACEAPAGQGAPSVVALSPPAGPVGTEVRVVGAGFSPEGNAVHFGYGYLPDLASPDGATLVFRVPGALDPACLFTRPPCRIVSLATEPGTYEVVVSNAQGASSAASFSVTAGLGP